MRKYMRQLCSAMSYCHCKMHVVHRDLKLDNLLLDKSDNVLLADFGWALSGGCVQRVQQAAR